MGFRDTEGEKMWVGKNVCVNEREGKDEKRANDVEMPKWRFKWNVNAHLSTTK